MSDRLGFIGLGRMGALMSKRLVDAGFTVTGYDPDTGAMEAFAAAGGAIANSEASVAEASDVVFLSLPSPQVVAKVSATLADTGGVRTVVDVSTTGPTVAKEASAALGTKGIYWFDCPVSGGLKGARDGTLAVMVSGPEAEYEVIRTTLEHFGKPFFVGEGAGLAQVAKLANNMLAAAAMVVSSEAMVMGVKAGINPNVLLDIFNASTGRNSATQDKFPRSVLPGTFDFGFHSGLSYKDVRLCVDESEALGVPMIAGAVVRQILAATVAKYGPTSDFTSIVKITEEWAGVEVRG